MEVYLRFLIRLVGVVLKENSNIINTVSWLLSFCSMYETSLLATFRDSLVLHLHWSREFLVHITCEDGTHRESRNIEA